jgi:hypothetical protein
MSEVVSQPIAQLLARARDIEINDTGSGFDTGPFDFISAVDKSKDADRRCSGAMAHSFFSDCNWSRAILVLMLSKCACIFRAGHSAVLP